MKICQVCAVDFTLKHFLLPLIKAMEKQNWSVTALCSDGEFVDEIRRQGFEVRTANIERSLNPIKFAVSIFRMVAVFRSEKFDIVHVHTPVAALAGRIAAKLSSVPTVIYTAHGFYFHDEMPSFKRLFFLYLEKWAGRYTDILFTQSVEDAICANKEFLQPNGNIYAIGNGVNPERFNPNKVVHVSKIKKNLGIPPSAFVVGIIARLVREKGIVEFLEAAIKAASVNKDIYFLIVGTRLDTDHAKDVTNKINKAKKVLDNRVIFLGHRNDIPELISVMDVYCLPSWREGMPRSIIEAMMMAKPVIATNIRGSREEVEEGKTGLLVSTKNSDELAEKFLYCFSSPEEIKNMGKAGRVKALREYNENTIVTKQVKIIKKIFS